MSLEFIACVYADRLKSSTGCVESQSKGSWLSWCCVSAMSPKEGKGAANDFLSCTDDPQHGLLVSGLAQRTPHWDAQGQYRFCGRTVTILTAHFGLIESSLLDHPTKSASMSLYLMYNKIVKFRIDGFMLCSDEGTVRAKNQLWPSRRLAVNLSFDSTSCVAWVVLWLSL